MIAQYCETDHRKWDRNRNNFMLAINSSHESTGFSPAFLIFGREIRILMPRSVTPEQHSHRMTKLQKTSELFKLNLSRAFQTQKKHYDLRSRNWSCHVGDRVMKREHPLSSVVKGFAAKLALKFSGPYKVTKVISPVVFTLKKDATGRLYKNIHVKVIKLAY